MEETSKIYPGALRRTPLLRDQGMRFSIDDWLEDKRTNDGAEGLWRIHDDIYDLTNFVKTHPGGSFWLEVTKGTDITEAFETHHLSGTAESLVKKFRVRKATTPRSTLITFHKNGFYRTLKRRVVAAGGAEGSLSGSTWQSRLLTDSLVVGYVIANLMSIWHDVAWSVPAGVFLYMLTVASHNFFHMRDNFRMYYFNLSFLSFRNWRVSHALSHHPFANTNLDLEISLFEPIFQYLPREDKSLLSRYLPWFLSPWIFVSLFHVELVRRCGLILLRKKTAIYWDEFLAFSVPIVMWLLSNESIWMVLLHWNISVLCGSFVFFLIGLTAAHHHPDIYHEGDYLGEDKDFGILQLAAVRDRKEINGNFFLAMITFGEHALHHMFPTIDHKKLEALTPCLIKTCKEFNMDYTLTTTGGLVKGMYQQLARNYTNGKLLIEKVKSS